ncbi:MAG: glycoside hydrolase family 13 protein [Bacteroidales bacterium]|nr:glycoside hydrolase family 13 protein [Bacteroidales bacterium]
MRKLIVVCFVFLQVIYGYSNYSIDRVEPPFWWTGMENSELQILVYGENIADLKLQFEYPGVALEKVVYVQNPNYVFIYVDINSETEAGEFEMLFTNIKGKLKASYTYELLNREDGSAIREGFNNTDVMYLITPDRFANGDIQNDNVEGYVDTLNRKDPDGRHGGDFQGLMDNLDYIEDMGYTAIWLNPVLENNMTRTSYHGYATTDYYKVDPRYGTNEEYKELGSACKQQNIKLIMDMVMNHCGLYHWWMADMPTADWINYGGEYVRTNHRRSTVQDPYVAPSERDLFHDGWFVSAMPDLNQKNPLLAKYLIQNSIWWIEYAHLQGIRHDTHSYPDKDFMSDWSCAILDEYPHFNIVGEEWSPNPAIVSYWQQGKINPDGYTSCMPGMMDFPTQINLIAGLNESETEHGKGFIRMYEMLANDFLYADPYNLVIFPDNHDMSRFITQINGDYGLFMLGISYILTMRGIPQIFYGTEILMSNPGTDAHGVIRSDFPGGWEGDEVNGFTGHGLTVQQSEAKDFMLNLLNWRKTKSCIHYGNLVHYEPKNGVYVYFRYDDVDKVMVILNKNENEVVVEKKRFVEIIDSESKGKDIISGRLIYLDDIKVPGRSPMILELD